MSRTLFHNKGTTSYSNKVLIGDWVTIRLNAAPEEPKANFESSSTYAVSYTPKPFSSAEKKKTWDIRLDSESSSLKSCAGRFEKGPNDYHNFSTTYDLAYNHFPKCYKGLIPRINMFIKGHHEPTNEYLQSYGNITKYGIKEEKTAKWTCEIWGHKEHISSYSNDFKAPKPEDYAFKRFGTPLPTEVDVVNIQEFRKRPFQKRADSSGLILGHKEKYCNPITWECTPDMKTDRICA